MALSEAIMKGQWPPQCLPPIMWSEEASSVSIERALVWLGDTAFLTAGETKNDTGSFFFWTLCVLTFYYKKSDFFFQFHRTL